MDKFKCGRLKISATYTNDRHTAELDVSEFENPIAIFTQHVENIDAAPFNISCKHEDNSDVLTVIISSTKGLHAGDYYVNYMISEACE